MAEEVAALPHSRAQIAAERRARRAWRDNHLKSQLGPDLSATYIYLLERQACSSARRSRTTIVATSTAVVLAVGRVSKIAGVVTGIAAAAAAVCLLKADSVLEAAEYEADSSLLPLVLDPTLFVAALCSTDLHQISALLLLDQAAMEAGLDTWFASQLSPPVYETALALALSFDGSLAELIDVSYAARARTTTPRTVVVDPHAACMSRRADRTADSSS